MKQINEYAKIYSYQVEYDQDDKTHIARCAELPSLAAHGDTPEEAIKEIKKVVLATLKWMSEDKEEIPEPLSLHKYSGTFPIRMPPEKHRKIAREARLQGVSMNQYIVSKL